MTLTQSEIDQLLTAGFSWDKIKMVDRILKEAIKRHVLNGGPG